MKSYTMKNGKRNTKNLKIERIPVLGKIKEKDISTGYVEQTFMDPASVCHDLAFLTAPVVAESS